MTALLAGAACALSLAALCCLFLVIRQSAWKRNSTVHVELTNLPDAYRVPLSQPAPASAVTDEAHEHVQRQTSVVDFADVPLCAEAVGMAAAQQREQEEKAPKEREQAVLQEVFEDNLRLREQGVSLDPAVRSLVSSHCAS
jgi:hypothetical protein